MRESPFPAVVVYTRLSLTAATPSVHVRLPRGKYDLQPVSCPFGWWWRGTEADIDGTLIRISLASVPITRVRLQQDVGGKTHTPTEVRLFIDTKAPDSSESSGEINLRFALQDEWVSIAQHWRNPDETWTRYALIFVWPDGTRTQTKLGDWNALLNTTDVGGP